MAKHGVVVVFGGGVCWGGLVVWTSGSWFTVLWSWLWLVVSGVVGRGLMTVWGVRSLGFGSLPGVPWCGNVVPGVTVVVVVVASGFVVWCCRAGVVLLM